MLSRNLLGAAAAATLALMPVAAWAQGGDANTTTAAGNSATAAPTDAQANLVMGNSAAAGTAAPAAGAAPADATADAAPAAPRYKVDRGFPWGVLGLLGLVGLIPLFRRRDG
jgi:hypothetical protein